MRAQPHFKLTRQAMLALLASAAFSAAAGAAPVARVEFTSGPVTAAGPGAKPRVVGKGSILEGGETIETGVNGRAQLRFTDGAYMSLQPQTAFRVDDYRWDGQTDGGEKGFFSLLKGGLRTITGAIGRNNRSTYQVTTSTATIGIRGTEYLLQVTNSDTLHVGGGEGVLRTREAAPRTFLVRERSAIFLADPKATPVYTQPPILPPKPAEVPARQGSQAATPPGQTESQQTEAPTPPPPAPRFIAGNQTTSTGAASIVPALTPPPGLLTGTATYNMAFANIDRCGDACFEAELRLNQTGTLDGSGRLVSFQDSDPDIGFLTIGTASAVDVGNDGLIAWGRWVNGTLGGDGSYGSPTLTGNKSLHYVVGIPTPASDMSLLQGGGVTATYSLLGATSPTTSTDKIGTLNSGSLTANFGTSQVNVNLNLTVSSSTYGVAATGLPITGSGFSGPATTTGCVSACSTDIRGFFAGANAARAGVAYRIGDFSSSNGEIFGAAAFKR